MDGLDLLLSAQHVYSTRQEALWADAKIDGRAVFSVRESYKLHKDRLLEIQEDAERIRVLFSLAAGTQQTWSQQYDSNIYQDSEIHNVNDFKSNSDATKVKEPFIRTYFNGKLGIFEHIAENLAELSAFVTYLQTWPCYQVDYADQQAVTLTAKQSLLPPFRLLIRKRPMLPAEISQGEWDVVVLPEPKCLTLFEGRVDHSGRRLKMLVGHYCADFVIGPQARMPTLQHDDKKSELFDSLELNSILDEEMNQIQSSLTLSQESSESESDLKYECNITKDSDRNSDKHNTPSLTILCFGQTGSGKTYSMRQIVTRVIDYDKNNLNHSDRDSDSVQQQPSEKTVTDYSELSDQSPIFGWRIQCFEVLGNVAYDLLDGRKRVKVLEDAQGVVHVKGQEVEVWDVAAKCTDDYVDDQDFALDDNNKITATSVLEMAIKSRLSEATERNSESSRSHAFFVLTRIIRIGKPSDDLESESKSMLYRSLYKYRLVDLAGSERNFETQGMTAAQHRQSSQIVASLDVLKRCMQILAKHSQLPSDKKNNVEVRIPFRDSKLTHILQDCFSSLRTKTQSQTSQSESDPESKNLSNTQNKLEQQLYLHRTLLIATISPCARDAIHSRNTLEHVSDMFGSRTRKEHSTIEPHHCDQLGRATGAVSTLSVQNEYQQRLPRLPDLVLNLPLLKVFDESQRGSMSSWSEEDVRGWLDHVANGRFAKLVLPEGLRDGKGLVSLQPTSLADLFVADTLRVARVREEGQSWNICGPEQRSKLGVLLYQLVQETARATESMSMTNKSLKLGSDFKNTKGPESEDSDSGRKMGA